MRSVLLVVVAFGLLPTYLSNVMDVVAAAAQASDGDESSSTGATNDDDVLMMQYRETKRKIAQWEEKMNNNNNNNMECPAETTNNDEEQRRRPSSSSSSSRSIIMLDRIVRHLPSREMAGVDQNLLRLCATVSGGVYEATTRADFETLLRESSPTIQTQFPDLTVRFFHKGVTLGKNWVPERLSLNAPTFVGLITGSTLILGWRGTVTVKDILADANIDSVAPWKALQGLQVQQAYYDMILNQYFKSHAADIVNYVKGNYSKKPNQMTRDGTPITKIILTGHSLGGGLAQVAHLCLRAPPNHRWSFRWTNLVNACQDVEIRTVAISAPMTTVLQNPVSAETTHFLRHVIEPYMRNIVFNADVVPRGYAHLAFIDGFVNAFLDENNNNKDGTTTTVPASSGLADQLARAFVKLHIKIFEMRGLMEQAKRYRHVGKLIYYDNPNTAPVLYADNNAGQTEDTNEKYFRDLPYGPKTKVADTALENHMVLVTGGTGLSGM